VEKLVSSGDYVLSDVDTDVASEFSIHINEQVLIGVHEVVINYLNDLGGSYGLPVESSSNVWLDKGWQVICIGEDRFRFGIFFDHSMAGLKLIIDDYIKGKRSRNQRISGKIKYPGRIRAVHVYVSMRLALDNEVLCERVVEKVNENYKCALIDYRSALRDYCLASASDDLYDVLRKSHIPESIQKEITLYCVLEAMGRHIPSLDRINEIVARLHSNTPNMDVCPLRLATDFFLTPLDGKRYELYTQRAFREGQAIVGPGNKASGESYVKLATESFFRRSGKMIQPPVVIQPIARTGDAWLLSAIYPYRLAEWILLEIERQKENFKRAMENIQAKHRDTMSKLERLTGRRLPAQKSPATFAGEFLGGIIKGFIS